MSLEFSLRRKQDHLQWKDEKEDDDVTSPSSSVESPVMATMGYEF